MKYVIKSDVGVVRKENQDRAAVFVGKEVTFAILCDGMGGHMGGSYAASLAIETFEKEFAKEEPSVENLSRWFQETVKKSVLAMKVKAQYNEALMDMGTTLTCAAIYSDRIAVFNIGDSRTYVYNGLLHQITEDQNLRNYYIDKHGYSADEASQIIGAAALTSALGPTKQTTIKPYDVPNGGDVKYVVLTSDGIHDYIAKPVFEQILAMDDTIDEKGELLIHRAVKGGRSSDNLTCIIVDLKDGE